MNRKPNILISVLQSYRVMVPYFQVNYAYPIMKNAYNGKLDICLVQHILNNQEKRVERLKKNKKILKYAEDGFYKNAIILRHDRYFKKYPSMPTYKKAVKYFLDNDYDYHLWIEDDAVVMDREINSWIEKMRINKASIGEFIIDPKNPTYMAKSQILFSDRGFNERFYQECLREETWDRSAKMVGKKKPTDKRLEFKINKLSLEQRTRVSRAYARIFWREPLSDKINMLNFLRDFVPEGDLKYIEMDFNMEGFFDENNS
ncbi:MAG: hypothetical protein ACOC56_00645 [Atribacterota bacterium]